MNKELLKETKFHLPNRHERVTFQKAVFDMGVTWSDGTKKIFHLETPYFTINENYILEASFNAALNDKMHYKKLNPSCIINKVMPIALKTGSDSFMPHLELEAGQVVYYVDGLTYKALKIKSVVDDVDSSYYVECINGRMHDIRKIYTHKETALKVYLEKMHNTITSNILKVEFDINKLKN